MDINELNKRINLGLKIYIGKEEVEIIQILNLLNLVEVKLKNDDRLLIIDSLIINSRPSKKNTISLGLFSERKNENDRIYEKSI